MKQGEHPKMPDPQCIKTYYQTTMMPKVPQKYGFLLQPNTQIVALRAHCTRTALKAPPKLSSFEHSARGAEEGKIQQYHSQSSNRGLECDEIVHIRPPNLIFFVTDFQSDRFFDEQPAAM